MNEVLNENKDLTKAEFETLVKIIDICAERGSFKGPELMTVGTIRERLVQLKDVDTNDSVEATD
jgi:hypothetical protein